MDQIKAAGIIAEYNPFHNGHQYQIEEIRRKTGADYVIAAMSGDFVQRGEPAVFDKYTRTRMALCGGADLVVELPALFATATAEDFASCGVALLDSLGADLLCFGSESGNLEHLQKAADILGGESAQWQTLLQAYLKRGETYPAARSLAVAELTKDPALSDLLASPNNILAVEYLKALKKQGSPMVPVTIRRKGSGYHDTDCSGPYASASAIRQLLFQAPPDRHPEALLSPATPCSGSVPLPTRIPQTTFDALLAQIPPESLEALLAEGALAAPLAPDDLTELLRFRLLSCLHEKEDLSCFSDLSPELAARLTRQALQFVSYSEQIALLKTKGYTYTRVSRALLHLLLGITTKQIEQGRSLHYAPYARILGFKKSAGPLLSRIRKQSRIPLITKTADAGKLLSAEAMNILETDFYASHVYQSILASHGRPIHNEYTKSVIVV